MKKLKDKRECFADDKRVYSGLFGKLYEEWETDVHPQKGNVAVGIDQVP